MSAAEGEERGGQDERDERARRDVGVGPWAGEWPAGDHWDPELLREGDRRNVADRYRYWRMEAVVADLDTRRHPFHVAIENWGHDFNIGSVVRTANAFNAAAFHVVGQAPLEPTGRHGHRPLPARAPPPHGRRPRRLGRHRRGGRRAGSRSSASTTCPGSVGLETYDLPRECVLVLGQEGPGLTPEMLAVCDVVLHVEQFGSTRSMNAGAAAAVAMHAWVRRHVFDQRPGPRRNRPGARAAGAAVTSAAPAAPALSVLDLVPVRSDQSSGDAIAATLALARVADEHGYRRYWLAEHHNMPAVAATNPPVLVAMVAGATERLRVGSGGVMLPNHAPLVVAEQFALLEAAFPGRVDLGIGRAPGTDPVTSWALRSGAGGVEADAADRFPDHVDAVLAMMSPDGAALRLATGDHVLRATPRATSVPTIWLLGSSDFSARLAASRGLPYVFAHHFSGRGTAEALALYREQYRPSRGAPASRAPSSPSTSSSRTPARRRSASPCRTCARWSRCAPASRCGRRSSSRTSRPRQLAPAHQGLADDMLRRWVVGTPAEAAAQVRALAAEHAVDEVMVSPVAGAFTGTAGRPVAGARGHPAPPRRRPRLSPRPRPSPTVRKSGVDLSNPPSAARHRGEVAPAARDRRDRP